MAVTFELERVTVRGLSRALIQLSHRYNNGTQTRKLLRPAAGIINNALRSTATVGKNRHSKWGPIKSSIRILPPKKRTQRSLAVGPSMGRNAKARYPDGWYYGLVDQGTKRSNRGGKGQRGQHMFSRGISLSKNAALRAAKFSITNDLKYIRF